MTTPSIVRFEGVTLYHADCRDVLPELKADAVITDPPYGLGENAKRVASRANAAAATDYGDFDWDTKPPSVEAIQALTLAAGTVVIWGGNYFHLPPSPCWFVWDKQNTGDFADCELAWTNLDGAVRIFRHMWNGMIRASEKGAPRVHPTQKPIALMCWCMDKAKVPKGAVVLDPYMGSGTTAIACIRTGRKFIGVEKDRKYFDTAVTRIARELEQPQLLPP